MAFHPLQGRKPTTRVRIPAAAPMKILAGLVKSCLQKSGLENELPSTEIDLRTIVQTGFLLGDIYNVQNRLEVTYSYAIRIAGD
jgi:hypothetical protein